MSNTPSFTIPGDHQVVLVNGESFVRAPRTDAAPVDELDGDRDLLPLAQVLSDLDTWAETLRTDPRGDAAKQLVRTLRWTKNTEALHGNTPEMIRLVDAMDARNRVALLLPESHNFEFWLQLFRDIGLGLRRPA